jgi:hypothetical protein
MNSKHTGSSRSTTSASAGSSACRANATRSPRRSVIRRDPGALRRHARAWTCPKAVLAVGARRCRHQQHAGRALSKRGVPVFNAPGANANAVKELVIAGMFLAARNICQAWDFARSLSRRAGDRRGRREGQEGLRRLRAAGRTLGVIGLGAIGVEVANAARALGMKVLGYDPQITVQRAWQLSSSVEQALSLDDLFAAPMSSRCTCRCRCTRGWSTRRG